MKSNGSRWTALTAACLVTLIAADAVRGQAFQNLDFESSIVEPNPSGLNVRALGWNFSGEDRGPTADRLRLGLHIGTVPLQRMATDLASGPRPGPPPIQGHFSVIMGPQTFPEPTALFPWMEQTGQIPSNARSIRLMGDQDPLIMDNGPSPVGWHLTLGGTEIPLIKLPNGILSGDVSSLAGTLNTLRIAIDPMYYRDVGGGAKLRVPHFFFDAIRFSPLHYTVVPEPVSSVLALICLAAYGMRSRQRRASAAG